MTDVAEQGVDVKTISLHTVVNAALATQVID